MLRYKAATIGVLWLTEKIKNFKGQSKVSTSSVGNGVGFGSKASYVSNQNMS